MPTNPCHICENAGLPHDNKYGNNNWIYPKITLQHAFECDCDTVWIHNVCASQYRRCPKCLKSIDKANTHVSTCFDYYFHFFIKYFKHHNELNYKNICVFRIFVMVFDSLLASYVLTVAHLQIAFSVNLFCVFAGMALLFTGLLCYMEAYWMP
jgi:hypothetical protein